MNFYEIENWFLYRNLKEGSIKLEDEPLSASELEEFHEKEKKIKNYIEAARSELGKINRDILRYSRAVDEVPGTAELLQYEKRFIELYEQGTLNNYYIYKI